MSLRCTTLILRIYVAVIATVALTKHLYPSSILYSVLLVRDIVLFLIISVLCMLFRTYLSTSCKYVPLNNIPPPKPLVAIILSI